MCSILALCCLTAGAWSLTPNNQELSDAKKWIGKHLGPSATDLPFSFTYASRPADLLHGWTAKRTTVKIDEGRSRITRTWTDPATSLQVRCEAVTYRDFPTVEWTLYFKNTGNADTPIIENIQALNTRFDRGTGAQFLLHHNVGSPANRSDYGPLETPLGANATKRISAAGGRATNSDMSYFNLSQGDRGSIIVVGWPGQWAVQFGADAAGNVAVTAGQELTHFRLHPGEEVRSPLIIMQTWRGGWLRAQNVWRRWMMAYGMPHPGGKLPPPQFVASSSRAYEEMIGANEANQIMHVNRYHELGIKLDYWWMDAGWYIQQHGWPQVGTWEPDPKRFPNGFKPISDRAHELGTKILVWFEPERVAPDTWISETHPEWLLSLNPDRAKANQGLYSHRSSEIGTDPNVGRNTSDHVITMGGIVWDPGRLFFHPGPKGEYSVIRWTAPAGGDYQISATFMGIDDKTTTDVHVLHANNSLFDGLIGVDGHPRATKTQQSVRVQAGDTVDFVVGFGNGNYQCDSTGIEAVLTGPDGSVHNAANDFKTDQNPAGEWSYGYLQPGQKPNSDTFRLYDKHGRGDGGEQWLLNLGNPEAWTWLVNHIDDLLTKNGIDLYRQDFNIDPLEYWRRNDAPDRQGITEIKHITGYLAYWDELRKRHPNMLIDSCASGGRRNDIETMRRAVPLWRSDYAYEPIGHQCMTYGISQWLPYHGTGTVACANASYYGGGASPIEPYAFWSNAAPSLGSGIDVREKGIDYPALLKLYHDWRALSEYYYGDYYPLTPYSQDDKQWIAWQFDRPDQHDGVVQIFRRAQCAEAAIQLKLYGINPKASYVVSEMDGANSRTISGKELAQNGLAVTIGDKPGASVLRYRQQ